MDSKLPDLIESTWLEIKVRVTFSPWVVKTFLTMWLLIFYSVLVHLNSGIPPPKHIIITLHDRLPLYYCRADYLDFYDSTQRRVLSDPD